MWKSFRLHEHWSRADRTSIQIFKAHTFNRVGPPEVIIRMYRVSFHFDQPEDVCALTIFVVLPSHVCFSSSVPLLRRGSRWSLGRPTLQWCHCGHISAQCIICYIIAFHSRCKCMAPQNVSNRINSSVLYFQTLIPWILLVRNPYMRSVPPPISHFLDFSRSAP